MQYGYSASARGSTPNYTYKSNNYDKLDKYFVKIKLRRYPTSEKSDLYEFKMALFHNGDPEDFCSSFVTST